MSTVARSRTLPRAVAFWWVGAVLAMFMAAAAAPSPLYVVYQSAFGFSALTLTAVFGVYAVALLASLLTVGSVSDHLGRRPVLIGALALAALSMGLFAMASSVGWLVAARVVQGVATGAALGTVSATLVDHAPLGNPRLAALVSAVATSAGLTMGALGSGFLVEYGPAPTRLVYILLAAAFVVAALGLFAVDETVPRGPAALASGVRALRPHMAFPHRIRPQVLALVPCLIATWALGGFYLSLGPSIAVSVLGLSNHLVGGAVIAALNVPGVLTAILLRDTMAGRAMTAGSAVFALGVLTTLCGVVGGSVWLFVLGTVVAGAGFGAAFLGVFRILGELGGPGERAELFSAVYVVSYLSFAIPTVLAGLLIGSIGLRTTAIGFGAVVAGLALLAVLLRRA